MIHLANTNKKQSAKQGSRLDNATIFRKIAASCTPEMACLICGIVLYKRKGVPARKIGKGNYLASYRDDRNPSLCFYQGCNRTWFYKDHGTNEGGDMIHFVAKALGIDMKDSAKMIDQRLNLNLFRAPFSKSSRRKAPAMAVSRPDQGDIERIADSLKLGTVSGVAHLAERGFLKVGTVHQRTPWKTIEIPDCWCLLDKDSQSAKARRISGEPIGTAKAILPHKWNNSPIVCPLDDSSEKDTLVICEGEKDMAAVLPRYLNQAGICAVAMPSANIRLKEGALPMAKKAIIHAQADQAGVSGALAWGKSLEERMPGISITYFIPSKMGADWADMLEGMSDEEVIRFFRRGTDLTFNMFTSSKGICHQDYPAAEAPSRAPKQRGSPIDIGRDERVRSVIRELPEADWKSSIICEKLGLSKSRSDRKKIERSLARVIPALKENDVRHCKAS